MLSHKARRDLLLTACMCLLSAGCYAPIRSEGIPAHELSPACRMPNRTAGIPLNYSSLIAPTPVEYLLGAGDLLEITAPDLIERGDARPFQVQVLSSGEIHLPRVGAVQVAELSLGLAQKRINEALAAGYLRNPGATVTLVQKSTANVVVLGAVQKPGVHPLPRYENDVAHALGAAGGLSEEAGDVIEVHRSLRNMGPNSRMPAAQPGWPVPSRAPAGVAPAPAPAPPARQPALPFSAATGGAYRSYRIDGSSTSGSASGLPAVPALAADSAVLPVAYQDPQSQSVGWAVPVYDNAAGWSPPPAWLPDAPVPSYGGFNAAMAGPLEPVMRIPLRGDGGQSLTPSDVMLRPGDVVVVPERRDDVFFVVGPLSQTNRVRFSVGSQDREIGSGFLLPNDREIDVVTAVAMAGYIDPIESPTTVTVHRTQADGMPLLIRVDLIRARTDPQEMVFVQPGDIIYLNPDSWWYSRRLFDHLLRGALSSALGRWLVN